MKSFRRILIGFLLLALALPATTVFAYKPIWGEENGIIEIPELVTSYAFYRDLPSGKVDAYYFAGKAGQQFSFGVQIPDLEDLQNYEVTVALFGPDLPEGDESQLPPDHPEELGALIFPSTVSEDFFEAFTQNNYLGRQKITTTLPTDGDYYLLVWHPEGLDGKYVLDSGRVENFAPGDFISSLSGGYKFACILDRALCCSLSQATLREYWWVSTESNRDCLPQGTGFTVRGCTRHSIKTPKIII